ncbi:MAG: sigma-70 family RNA polymerase sigma factor [Prevotellaceae bacterium]|jgi:RNA polymerase sigma factor (sigma-70 family)|nr:sigma-70 family RNA polymerase sigma factor [Prevotellaceae bacterium]
MEKFTLRIYNPATAEYEEVEMTEEIYNTYRRTDWGIENNDASFFGHEIQFSGLVGELDNFRELVSDEDNPEEKVIAKFTGQALRNAYEQLNNDEQKLIAALFFEGKTERQYAGELGVYHNAVHKRKLRILKKLKNILEN